MPEDVKRILVVEDNQDNRTLIKDILSMMEYDIIEAVDGVQGVEMAEKEKPALILMDLSLPQKDGWEATKEIKANKDLAHIPIIALTAHAMLGDREKALEAGCNDYISKPVNMMELREKISRHLAAAAGKAGEASAAKDGKKPEEAKAEEAKDKADAADKTESDA